MNMDKTGTPIQGNICPDSTYTDNDENIIQLIKDNNRYKDELNKEQQFLKEQQDMMKLHMNDIKQCQNEQTQEIEKFTSNLQKLFDTIGVHGQRLETLNSTIQGMHQILKELLDIQKSAQKLGTNLQGGDHSSPGSANLVGNYQACAINTTQTSFTPQVEGII